VKPVIDKAEHVSAANQSVGIRQGQAGGSRMCACRFTGGTNMPTVLISHSSTDKTFVRELVDFLERHNVITVWLDERAVAPGQTS
jgi:TIR domain